MSPARTIGLLLVHGIGEQRPGATAEKFIRGFCAARDDARGGKDGGRPTLSVGETTVRIYEVHWADVLDDVAERAFDFDAFSSWAWFPPLNRRAGVYREPLYSRFHVFVRTLLLVPLITASFFAFHGARAILGRVQRATRSGWEGPPSPAEAARQRRAEGLDLDDLLDRSAGDVVTYVNSAGAAVPVESPVAGRAARILSRFHEAMRAACAECDEVQVLAHSLGTVVAYHGLTGHGSASGAVGEDPHEPLTKLTRVYTIGSPLEKFRFLWPKLISSSLAARVAPSDGGWVIEPAAEGVPAGFRWDNFYSRVDAVSGKLRRFDHWVPVRNHPSRLGGLVRSHTMYERSPVFLEVVTEGLTGRPSRPKHGIVRRAWNSISAAAENAIAPLLLGMFLVIGLVSIAFLGWGFGIGVAGGLDLDRSGENAVKTWSMAAAVVGACVLLVTSAWRRARRSHTRYWSTR